MTQPSRRIVHHADGLNPVTGDQGGASQLETARETWNVKGDGNNAWHRVTISVASTP